MSYQELDEQHKKFIDRYLTTLDPTSSAIDAGFDRKNANMIGLRYWQTTT